MYNYQSLGFFRVCFVCAVLSIIAFTTSGCEENPFASNTLTVDAPADGEIYDNLRGISCGNGNIGCFYEPADINSQLIDLFVRDVSDSYQWGGECAGRLTCLLDIVQPLRVSIVPYACNRQAASPGELEICLFGGNSEGTDIKGYDDQGNLASDGSYSGVFAFQNEYYKEGTDGNALDSTSSTMIGWLTELHYLFPENGDQNKWSDIADTDWNRMPLKGKSRLVPALAYTKDDEILLLVRIINDSEILFDVYENNERVTYTVPFEITSSGGPYQLQSTGSRFNVSMQFAGQRPASYLGQGGTPVLDYVVGYSALDSVTGVSMTYVSGIFTLNDGAGTVRQCRFNTFDWSDPLGYESLTIYPEEGCTIIP